MAQPAKPTLTKIQPDAYLLFLTPGGKLVYLTAMFKLKGLLGYHTKMKTFFPEEPRSNCFSSVVTLTTESKTHKYFAVGFIDFQLLKQ